MKKPNKKTKRPSLRERVMGVDAAQALAEAKRLQRKAASAPSSISSPSTTPISKDPVYKRSPEEVRQIRRENLLKAVSRKGQVYKPWELRDIKRNKRLPSCQTIQDSLRKRDKWEGALNDDFSPELPEDLPEYVRDVLAERGEDRKFVMSKKVFILASDMVPLSDMATVLGVKPQTLVTYYLPIIKEGMACTRRRLRIAQIQAALNGDPTMLKHLGKQYLRQYENPIHPGDTLPPGMEPIGQTPVTRIEVKLIDGQVVAEQKEINRYSASNGGAVNPKSGEDEVMRLDRELLSGDQTTAEIDARIAQS